MDRNKDIDMILMIKLHKLHNSLPKGRDSQGRILKILAEHEGISQKKLQEIIDIQPGSLSEVLLKLEKLGLICKKQDGDDKRRQNVYITDAGREAFEQLFTQHEKDSHEFFKPLSEDEKQTLLDIMKKLTPDTRSGRHQEREANRGGFEQ